MIPTSNRVCWKRKAKQTCLVEQMPVLSHFSLGLTIILALNWVFSNKLYLNLEEALSEKMLF